MDVLHWRQRVFTDNPTVSTCDCRSATPSEPAASHLETAEKPRYCPRRHRRLRLRSPTPTAEVCKISLQKTKMGKYFNRANVVFGGTVTIALGWHYVGRTWAQSSMCGRVNDQLDILSPANVVRDSMSPISCFSPFHR